MKTRVRSSALRSPSPTPSFYTYLKPGALAQLRYSKITARSKEFGAQALIALSQLNTSSDLAFSQPHSTGLAMDGIPCFNLRVKSYGRCLQRKKLIAVTPFFSETQIILDLCCSNMSRNISCDTYAANIEKTDQAESLEERSTVVPIISKTGLTYSNLLKNQFGSEA
ncbi:hypothetical protein BUALT_Bualt03G0076900 [Buddleja alternifolia]|uniref:Uncharacterized protein n=1 Tax=Buddleja alternifolia TaxID=168488 RepID=A0AAV6XTE9_9LAMI|nr:hypothetical protein BUALT_Bualt03G0076900 [Buddleja alternifolia]